MQKKIIATLNVVLCIFGFLCIIGGILTGTWHWIIGGWALLHMLK